MAGKSRKNVKAFILLPPESQRAIDVLIDKRSEVGVPQENRFVFARLHALTPLSGHTDLKDVISKCSLIECPDRITTRNLRKYIATVSQVTFTH